MFANFLNAIFDNKDGLLTPGIFGRLRLFGGERETLLVPDSAIASDQSRKIVFTVADDGTVGTKLIETGPIVDGLRVIRSGLAPTDRIVIDGLQRARPGQKVKPEDGKIEPTAQKAEARSRRKGREQREAAEQGKTVRFYAKEIARKGLNPLHRSAHFEK